MSINDIVKTTLELFDEGAQDLSQEQYKDCLEQIIDLLESRLDCVTEELEQE